MFTTRSVISTKRPQQPKLQMLRQPALRLTVGGFFFQCFRFQFFLAVMLCISCQSVAPLAGSAAPPVSQDSPSSAAAVTAPGTIPGAAALRSEVNVGRNCYLQSFSADDFPWPTSSCLNIEEVFKNFQFLEAKWDPVSQRLVVTQYRAGAVESVRTFIYDKHQAKLRPAN